MRSLLEIFGCQKTVDNRLHYAEYVTLPNKQIQLQVKNTLPHYEDNVFDYIFKKLKEIAILPNFSPIDSIGTLTALKKQSFDMVRQTRTGRCKLLAPKWFIEKHKKTFIKSHFILIESDLPKDMIILSVSSCLDYNSGVIFGTDDGKYIDSLYINKNYKDYLKVISLNGTLL